VTTETTPAFIERPDLARVAARIPLDATDPAERWAGVLAADGATFRDLCHTLEGWLGGPLGRPLLRALAELLMRVGWSLPSHLHADARHLARASGALSPAEFALLQWQYVLVTRVQAAGLVAGCSVSACWDPEAAGWRVLRNLDWGRGRLRATFAAATRHYLLTTGPGRPADAAVIGFPGMLGAVTGVRLGPEGRPAWAVALNSAPWRGFAVGPGEEPTLMLAALLTGPATDWQSARATLLDSRVGAPALVTLVGCGPEEASVFAFAPGRPPLERRARDGLLLVTNHFDEEGPLARWNPNPHWDDPLADNLFRSSRARAAALAAAVADVTDPAARHARLLDAHRASPVHCVRSVHLLALDLARPWPALRVWTPGPS
jgi:hypothetical protein